MGPTSDMPTDYDSSAKFIELQWYKLTWGVIICFFAIFVALVTALVNA